MSMYAESGRLLGVEGTPSEADMETAQERSGHFLSAWKVMTGNDMQGGCLSTQKRIELAAGIPEIFRNQARELRDAGICHFTER
jgi:hypothetical protein